MEAARKELDEGELMAVMNRIVLAFQTAPDSDTAATALGLFIGLRVAGQDGDLDATIDRRVRLN